MSQQTLKDIFSGYKSKHSVFMDRNILDHEYLPETAVHREAQTKQLANILAPAMHGSKTSNIFLYGKTGTGKTLVSRNVAEELEKNTDTVKVLYVNCKMKKISDTEYRLFAELARTLGEKIPPTGLPTDEVYRRFYSAIDNQKRNVIIVLDEIDALVKKIGDDILYNLTRANHNLKSSRISIIGISNNVSFIEDLDPRVKSSLSEEEIVFPPYNAHQLQDILKQRAKTAFYPGAVDSGVIQKCAALAAQEHGDARKALDLLRIAGELGERKGDERITIQHVDDAENKLDTDRVVEVVRSQPKQSLLVLTAIIKLTKAGQKNIQTGDIFSVYEKLCPKSRVRPLTQRRVSDLIAELDMLGIINAKVISKGRYGRTREISFTLPGPVQRKVEKVLEDHYLA